MSQGHIWQEGFATGALTADMYEDVQPAMAAWVRQGLRTYIYSSGSREAQRNLFGHTKNGDLRGLLSGFFDTKSGSKVCDYCCAEGCSVQQQHGSTHWSRTMLFMHACGFVRLNCKW